MSAGVQAPERASGGAGTTTYGLLAQFESPRALLHAAEKVRDAGYRRWDAHTPFPVHGLEGAMGLKPTILPWLVFGGGLTGALAGLALQWWTNAVDYRFIISGKPFLSLPANIPVIFELTILLAALTAFFGMLVLNRLPEWYHALFRSSRFRRVTTDGFFICIQATDPVFDLDRSRAFLESIGATHVEVLED
jgi:hypothetical protein